MKRFLILGFDLTEYKENKKIKDFLKTPLGELFLENEKACEISIINTQDKMYMGYLLWSGTEDEYKRKGEDPVDYAINGNNLTVISNTQMHSKNNFDIRCLDRIISCILGSHMPTEPKLLSVKVLSDKKKNSIKDNYSWRFEIDNNYWSITCPICGHKEKHNLEYTTPSLPNSCEDCGSKMTKKIGLHNYLESHVDPTDVGVYAIVTVDDKEQAVYFANYSFMNEPDSYFLESPCSLHKIEIPENTPIDDFCKKYVTEIVELEDFADKDEYINTYLKPMIRNNVLYEIENFQTGPFLPKVVDNIKIISESECLDFILNTLKEV